MAASSALTELLLPGPKLGFGPGPTAVARATIRAGEAVEQGHACPIGGVAGGVPASLARHLYPWQEHHPRGLALVLGHAMAFGTSPAPNLVWTPRFEQRRIDFTAARDIARGEALTVSRPEAPEDPRADLLRDVATAIVELSLGAAPSTREALRAALGPGALAERLSAVGAALQAERGALCESRPAGLWIGAGAAAAELEVRLERGVVTARVALDLQGEVLGVQLVPRGS